MALRLTNREVDDVTVVTLGRSHRARGREWHTA